ncbi:MAG: GNAT family N-acetyltransferase, partial [Chloroflexi bacterium]|nr:GNAT family N-acetyltransferase [Chloroflexota bacterium]
MRDSIDLSGVWLFQPDPALEGDQLCFPCVECDDRLWREVYVPSCWDDAVPGLADYEGGGWYRRRLEVPVAWRGRRIVLRFYGVQYHAQVWVQGALLEEHPDGFLGFEVDITDQVNWEGGTLLAVRADNVRRAGEVPGLERGWRPSGGIARRVELLALPVCHLDQLRVQALPSGADGRLSLQATVRNQGDTARTVSLRLSLSAGPEQALQSLEGGDQWLPAQGEATLTLEATLPGVTLWSPERPQLYDLDVALIEDGRAIDSLHRRTGFRSISARDGSLLLNGEPIRLYGFNRHEDAPRSGMAEDLAQARSDLLAMRDAGANMVRLCHYPHHPDELDLCDELGLLVMGEIPLYWWRGDPEGDGMTAAKRDAAERQLFKMIARDGHHPSIIIWSVSNETDEHLPEVAAGNAFLVRRAQEWDPTRLAVHVSHRWRGEGDFSADDLLCVNAYPSLNRRGLDGETFYDLEHSTQWWRQHLADLHRRYPERPILVTEFGYAALEGSQGGALGEDLQAQAIAAELAGMDAPWVCGALVWCWADHAWPANVFRYCHGLAVSPYGVVNRARHPKRALASVRDLFYTRRGLERPAAPSLDVTATSYLLRMVRPTLEGIPEVPFPEGYGIRPIHQDEGGLWVDILRDAEPVFTLQDGLFERTFAANLPATAWRCYLITSPRNTAVGTVSAWSSNRYHGEAWGQVHWVATRPAFQRLGLARAGLAYTLQQLARWHTRAFLETHAFRQGAIRLYLDMGFEPDLDFALA